MDLSRLFISLNNQTGSMRPLGNIMKYLCLLALLMTPLKASAVVATVTNVFTSGQKIVASQMNANFNDILGAINGQLADENIIAGGIGTISLASGSVTSAKMAAGTNYYIENHRKGCTLAYLATGSVYVKQPCELIVDGSVGRLTASATVTEANLDTGLFAANKVYYVYGKPTAANSVSFQFSAATPTITTARKPTDSTYRYIGSAVTGVGTTSLINFRQNGSRYRFFSSAGGSGYSAPSMASGITVSNPKNYFVNVPNFSQYIYSQWLVSNSGAAVCTASYTPNGGVSENIGFASLNGTIVDGREEHRLILDQGFVTQLTRDSACDYIQVSPQSYEEPQELY